MSLPTTYLLNVALHAGVLSVFAALLVVFLRLPQQRSFVAIAGLLVVGFLPWITALRPAPKPRALPPITELQAAHSPAELPIWTIVTVPMKNDFIEPFTPTIIVENKGELPDLLTGLIVLWAAGTSIGLVLFTVAWVKVMLWRKSLTHLDDTTWQRLRGIALDHMAQSDFLICPTNASPCVVGFWRPRIVIPHFLLDQPSTEKLNWAVRHEIAHLQAGDSRWMMFFTLIRCVNWWNPFTHRLVDTWADAREELCDLHATSSTGNRADYGEFLITIARKITKQPPLAIAMAKRLHARRLEQRIVSLLDSKANGVKPLGKSFVSISGGLFVFVVALVPVLKISAEDVPTITASTINETIPKFKEEPPVEQASPPAIVPPSAVNKPEKAAPTADPKQAKRQIKFSTKLVLTNFETGFIEKVPDGGRFTLLSVFSEGQEQMIMRGFAREPGTMLKAGPSMIMRSNQEGTLNLFRNVIRSPDEIAQNIADPDAPWVGITQKIVAQFSDDSSGIDLKLDMEYRFIPGSDHSMNELLGSPLKGLDTDKIAIVKKTVSGILLSNCTVAISFGEIERGKYLTVLARAQILDENGRPIDFEELVKRGMDRRSIIVNKQRADEGTLPLPEIPGTLRLSATLVDLPLTKPKPPGDGLVIGLTPTVKSIADKIQATRGAKVRKLKTIDVPLNQPTTPWPEFPGLSLSALVSKNHKVISLNSHAVGTGEEEFPNIWEQAPGDVMNFGIRTADKSVERRLLITIEGVK